MQWQTILSYLLLVMVIVILGTKTVQCRDQHDISVGSLNNHLMHSPAAALAGKHPPPGTSRSTSNKNEFALYNRPRSIQRFDFRCPAIDRSNSNSTDRDEDDDQPQTGNLTIVVSPRVLPQLVARIYAIYLQDRLRSGHTVQFKTQEMTVIPAQVKVGEISLENWQMPDTHEQGQNSHHGTLYATGVVGWFIPTGLLEEGEEYPNLQYTMFLNSTIQESTLEQFSLDRHTENEIKEYAELNTTSNEFPTPIRVFTPSHCIDRECVIILAGYYKETRFVESHIERLNISARVIWFGRNLRRVVHLLYDKYHSDFIHDDLHDDSSNNRIPLSTNHLRKKFIVMDYSPSITINGHMNFTPIVMPTCKEILRYSYHCAYTYMPVVKYYKFPRPLEHVAEFTSQFKFEELDYLHLIKVYEERLELLHPEIDHDETLSINDENDLLNNLACDIVNNDIPLFLKQSTDHPLPKPTPRYVIGLLVPPPEQPSIYGNIAFATQLAVQSVNTNTQILKHIRLEVRPQYVSCEALPLMRAYHHYHSIDRDLPVIGIIGPPCTHGLDAVNTYSEVIGMTTIAYSATVNSFMPNNGYRNFFRTSGEGRYFDNALLQILKIFNWRRIAILSEEGLTSSYLNVGYDSQFKDHGIDLLIHQKMPAMHDPRSEDKLIQNRLNDLKDRRAKIILMEIYDVKTAIQVMCDAKRLNMTAKDGFVWIVPSWIGDFQFSAPNVTTCTREEIVEALNLQFSFDFPVFGNDTQVLPHLGNITIGAWKEYTTRLSKQRQNTAALSKYTGYIFDAVWTYAFAFDYMLKHERGLTLENSIHHPDRHPRFLEVIKSTNFTGVSGQIDFGQGQSRRPQVIFCQWRGLKLQRVGAESSITNNTMVLDSGEIRWPNGLPTDGRIVCSVQPFATFFGTDCDTAILIITVLISFTGAILASFAFYIYVRRFYNQKIKLSAQVMRNLGIDLLNTTHAPENLLNDWEMPKDQIMLNRKLGEGAFGTVYGGQAYIDGSLDLQAVAVKTLKIGSTAEDKMDFLSEAEAMKRFNHPCILKLLGVCLQSEPIFSVIEFMLYGDLKTYLLARRHLVKDRIPDDSDVSAKRLTLMTTDILRGLAYLAEMKYVHRDIACRNCLVNADRRVKIADFGMARPTGSNDYYRFSRKGLLPVRWLSPESLGSGFFTPASDIWSFGVLLFEIVSFGAFPYQGLSNNQVLEFVKNGGSMNIPEGVKPPLERLMRNCWAPDYKKRPTALQILDFVNNNPRIVSPCVDIPHFSIQFSDSESDDFMQGSNPSPDSGVGMPITRETLQQLSSMPTSQAAAEVFQMHQNGNGPRGFLKANNGVGGGVPNGNGSLTYNPIEPLLLRQNSNELSSSSSSLLLRYVPMCGFGSKKSNGNLGATSMLVGEGNRNYANHNPVQPERRNTLDDTEYTRMTITEF